MLLALALVLAPLPPQQLAAAPATAILAARDQVPDVTVTTAVRSTYAQAIGFDWEYDDGTADLDETFATSGNWLGLADADLVDYWGAPVAHGSADQDTAIDASGLLFDLESDASAAGNHFQADSLGEAEFSATFAVGSRVRFLVSATTSASGGYHAAELELRAAGGPTLVRAATSAWAPSAPASVQQHVGWLDAGTYQLTCTTSAMAYSSSGQPDAGHFAHVEGVVRWFHAADFDLDGDVDRFDLRHFRLAWRAGDAAADFDGDGLVTFDDLVGFVTRYRRG